MIAKESDEMGKETLPTLPLPLNLPMSDRTVRSLSAISRQGRVVNSPGVGMTPLPQTLTLTNSPTHGRPGPQTGGNWPAFLYAARLARLVCIRFPQTGLNPGSGQD